MNYKSKNIRKFLNKNVFITFKSNQDLSPYANLLQVSVFERETESWPLYETTHHNLHVYDCCVRCNFCDVWWGKVVV